MYILSIQQKNIYNRKRRKNNFDDSTIFLRKISNQTKAFMKTELFTLCDFAQEQNGKLTIVGTFDTIVSRNFPNAHPQLSIVIRLRFDLWEFGTHSFKIETRNLDGEMNLEPVIGRLTVKGAGNATAVSHLVYSITNLKFKSSGVINFILYIDDKEITSIPLYLRQG
jgi:hypothetical protein